MIELKDKGGICCLRKNNVAAITIDVEAMGGTEVQCGVSIFLGTGSVIYLVYGSLEEAEEVYAKVKECI